MTALGAYILILGDARSRDSPVADVGLLGLMTLDNSAVAERLSAFKMRDAQARRRAGAFLVDIVEGRLVLVDGDLKPRNTNPST